MQARQGFSSNLGFVLAAAGSAVGLGNIWGFPTQAANHGGGAFILLYLLVLLVLAVPALYAELSIGHQTRQNPVSALRSSVPQAPRLGAIAGYLNVLGALFMLGFYSVIAGWMFAHCLGQLSLLIGLEPLSVWLGENSVVRNLLATALVLLLTAGIIVSGVQKGIEAWSKRLMPMLIVLMVGLITYIMTLPGAASGLLRFITPDLNALSDPKLALAAMGQAFFSLSVGVGGMLVYGSYLQPDEKVGRLSFAIAGLDTMVALLAGLLIIPALYVAQSMGSIISQNGELIGRSQLIFEVLPQLFAQLGSFGPLIGSAFFGLLAIASLTSTIASTEVPVSFLHENHSVSRPRATLVVTLLVALLSTIIVAHFDVLFRATITLLTHYMLPMMGLVYFIVLGWCRVYPKPQSVPAQWVRWHIRYLCPVLMLLVLYEVGF